MNTAEEMKEKFINDYIDEVFIKRYGESMNKRFEEVVDQYKQQAVAEALDRVVEVLKEKHEAFTLIEKSRSQRYSHVGYRSAISDLQQLKREWGVEGDEEC